MAEKYKKLDSFINFTGKFESYQEIILSDIDSLFSKSRENLSISKYEQTILDRIYKDLFIKNDNVNNKRFSISKYAIDEILSYKKKNFLPKYLVHRYRYEMFPQLYELDNYPPYLQIEPTSFCNFRCVFCYQTDGTLTSKNNGHMGHMTIDTFKSIVDQTTGNIEFVSLASRGEPLLCPDIEEMLAYTRDKYLNKAFLDSFITLMNKILLTRDLVEVSDIKLKEIKNLVSSFQILEESYSKGIYDANFKIIFNKFGSKPRWA